MGIRKSVWDEKVSVLNSRSSLHEYLKTDPLNFATPLVTLFVVEQNRTKSFEDEAMSLVLFVHS